LESSLFDYLLAEFNYQKPKKIGLENFDLSIK